MAVFLPAVKIIEKDTPSELEIAMNAFLSTGALVLNTVLGEPIQRNDVALDNGNKIYTAVIFYNLLT